MSTSDHRLDGAGSAMTLAVFTFSLLGAMALGMPIAFALIVCGVALMHSLDIFDFADRRPEHHQRRRQFSADGRAVLHAGRRDDEPRRSRQAHRQRRARAGRPPQGRPRLRHHPRLLRACLAVRLGRGRRCGAGRAARAHDGRGRPQQDVCGRPRRRRRHHRARHSAEHRLRAVRRRRRRLDLETVPGRHLPRPDARRRPLLRLVVGRARREYRKPAAQIAARDRLGLRRRILGA